MSVDPLLAVEALAASRTPYLIGIRHHSPILACAVPQLLDLANPDLILLELPLELQPWLPWLAAAEAQAPLALAASRRDGHGLLFYPYADFSPELAAVRWAHSHEVPVEAFDLPLGLAVDDSPRRRTRLAPDEPLTDALRRAAHADSADELWDRTVEARAPGSDPEAVRRAALALGWSLRYEHETWGEVPQSDLRREAWMRQRLQTAPHWRDHIPFHEYFHGDSGRGAGASHQTGWTAVVANLLQHRHSDIIKPNDLLAE